MGAERSFSTPLMVGSALLVAAILLALWLVPLADCPRCYPWYNAPTDATSFRPMCWICNGETKIPWLKRVFVLKSDRYRIEAVR